MNNFQTSYSVIDSGRSSRSSVVSSDSEGVRATSSRNSNYDKYFKYRNDRNKTRNIYQDNKKSSVRPGSRSGIQSKLMDHFSIVGGGKDPDGFVRRNKDEDCLKCMLKIPHKTCESHKYIRVGGGYRHSYYYVRMLLEHIELKKQKDELIRQRLQAISEGTSKAYKTYIRTKSGRLIQKIIYLNEEDYLAFKDILESGGDPSTILENYLSKDEMDNLDSYDREEQQAIKTYIRTKSGKMIERVVYVSRKEYDAIQREEKSSNDTLKKRLGLKPSEKLEGLKKSNPRTIITKIRTKSGRIIEKKIEISEEDYLKLQDGNSDEILKKYLAKDPDAQILGWEKSQKPGMKSFITIIRTKSGRLIEKTILMTEDEYKEFQKSEGDPNFLKKYLDLKEGETIDKWEKSSTVYEASDDELSKVKPGKKIKDKDGNEYEVVIDPLTGKKYKKMIKDVKNPKMYNTKVQKVITEKDIKKRKDFKEGKRNANSDSDFSYKSYISAGGTRHVKRRKKNADGTYGDALSYHSSQDEDGKARRRNRRRKLKHGPDSANSYKSFVSEGGTRHIRRRKRNADGTYGEYESYHSEDSDIFKAAEKSVKSQKKKEENKKKEDSDNSYFSDVSEGGTKKQVKRKRIRDENGNIIGYGKEFEHDGKGRVIDKKGGKKGREHGAESDYSYFSDVSIGGTHYRKRKKKIRDKNGKVIGYKKEEEYSSDSGESFISVSDGRGGRMKVSNPKKKRPNVSNVFSDATTDSDIVNERMKNMTKEEKDKYLADRSKRNEEREQKRKEKYGENYKEMAESYKKKKEINREKAEKENNAKKIKTVGKSKILQSDGNEADVENEKGEDIVVKTKKKVPKANNAPPIIDEAKFKKEELEKQAKTNKNENEVEIASDDEYSEKVSDKKSIRRQSSSDDGNYFEIGSDGKYRLKSGIKDIDMKNLSMDDLIKLGIDPNLSKAEQLRLLKEMFGDDIVIVYNKKKIGLKNADDYGSDASTDFLANESDIDIDTVKPDQRVKIIMKRGGKVLQDHIKSVIQRSLLQESQSKDEKNSKLNFLTMYRLVDPQNLDKYVRYFAIEDHDDLNGIINYKGCRAALGNLKRTQVINNLTEKQIDYILLALDINKYTKITFRMFSVIAALGDRMTKLDSYCRDLLEISDLLDIERKLKFYRELFHMNERSDRDPNYVKVESISIDLKAGGLNKDQQAFVLSKLRPNEILEISFLDFLSYIPLFISYHDNIVNNPLDSSSNKYSNTSKRRASIQRDMNPLGYNLSRNTQFYKKHNGSQFAKSRNIANPHTDKASNLNIIGKAKEKLSRYPVLPGINHL